MGDIDTLSPYMQWNLEVRKEVIINGEGGVKFFILTNGPYIMRDVGSLVSL